MRSKVRRNTMPLQENTLISKAFTERFSELIELRSNDNIPTIIYDLSKHENSHEKNGEFRKILLPSADEIIPFVY